MTSASDTAAVKRLTAEKYLSIAQAWQALQNQIDGYRGLIEAAEVQQGRLQDEARACFGTAELFGFDLQAVINERAATASADAPSEATPPPSFAPAVATPINVKDFVLEAAKAAYPRAVRAAALRRRLQEAGRVVHEKTIGMTLYRLSRYGLIRRDGFDWFYVHEMERDEAPADAGTSLFN